jgi:hypothetical protein
LIPFTYAPFFLLFSDLFGKKKRGMKATIPVLAAYAFVLLVVSLGRNSRGAFMLGLSSIGFSYILGLMLNVFNSRILTLSNIGVIVLAVWLLTGPLMDLGTAMVIVRSQRNDVPRSELIGLTLEAYNNKQLLRLYKSAAAPDGRGWDEYYIDNIFVGRLCNLKFIDFSLLLASDLSPHDRTMTDYSISRFWSYLPSPLLRLLGVKVDKEFVMSVSFGDMLYHRTRGSSMMLGGYKSGHFSGTGLAAFGWWYLPMFALLMLPVFYIFDVLTSKNLHTGNVKAPDSLPNVVVSFAVLLILNDIFGFLPVESVVDIAGFLLRSWIQLVFLYILVFQLTLRMVRFTNAFVFRQ